MTGLVLSNASTITYPSLLLSEMASVLDIAPSVNAPRSYRISSFIIRSTILLIASLAVVHISTWISFSVRRLSLDNNLTPSMLPYAIPFFGHALSLALNPVRTLSRFRYVMLNLDTSDAQANWRSRSTRNSYDYALRSRYILQRQGRYSGQPMVNSERKRDCCPSRKSTHRRPLLEYQRAATILLISSGLIDYWLMPATFRAAHGSIHTPAARALTAVKIKRLAGRQVS